MDTECMAFPPFPPTLFIIIQLTMRFLWPATTDRLPTHAHTHWPPNRIQCKTMENLFCVQSLSNYLLEVVVCWFSVFVDTEHSSARLLLVPGHCSVYVIFVFRWRTLRHCSSVGFRGSGAQERHSRLWFCCQNTFPLPRLLSFWRRVFYFARGKIFTTS